ncbi:MAG: ABC transporter ATP-binding protein [Calditrichaeota bacterium]|nr:MAG: ABC transporter ATP-binding protein [Calditrichota bacterium]
MSTKTPPETSSDAPAIVLENVTCRYGALEVFKQISLGIAPGQVTVLIGPSGSGKTTLLGLMNGMVRPQSGRVLVRGQDLARADLIALRRRIGYVIQEVGLFPHYTVYQNIALVPRLLKWEEARIRNRVEALLGLIRIPADRLNAYPDQLSGGQQQRVGVARALAADPDILLMDEPFGALDPITREQLQDDFLALQRRLHKTVVFVTHDMDEALKLGDRIVLLNQGRIVQAGHPFQFLLQPANDFVRSFVGRHRLLTAIRLEQLQPWLPSVQVAEALPRQEARARQKAPPGWLLAPEQPDSEPVLWQRGRAGLQRVQARPTVLQATDTLESALAVLLSRPGSVLLIRDEPTDQMAAATVADLQGALSQALRELNPPEAPR